MDIRRAPDKMDREARQAESAGGNPALGPAGRPGSGSQGVELSKGSGRDFDVQQARADFPLIGRDVHPGVPLVYMDSGATSLKPLPVIRAVDTYLSEYSANVHRGLHVLSERATEAFEGARETVARYLNAADSAQIVFTRGTTESINLVARSWGGRAIGPGESVVVSDLEHHSNLVPWQMLARERGCGLKFAQLTEDGRLDLDSLGNLLTPEVRLVAVTGMSNVTGAISPLGRIIPMAHAIGAKVLVDAAQSLPHASIDVNAIDVDFLAFSGHKVFGPTGIGVLYGNRDLLDAMPPMLGGGNMVLRVDRDGAEWNEVPWKFEAGTPPIAEAIGLAAALDYIAQFRPSELAAHERGLLAHAHEVLRGVKGFRPIGPDTTDQKGPIVSFTMDGIHPHDLAQLVDRRGIAIRAGHHCAMPLHTRLGIPASARASLALYNTLAEIDLLAEALEAVGKKFRRR